MPVIGFVIPDSPDDSSDVVRAFRQGLGEKGYIEGRNVTVEYHWLQGQYDDLPSLMADLVRRRVAVIATPGSNRASHAAKAATTMIPIIFGVNEDPVRSGLVASFARPGGNATGISSFVADMLAQRLALLHELVPKAVRIAVLVNPANVQTTEITLRDMPEAARATGLQIQVLKASTSREIEEAFATLVSDRADALVIAPDSFFGSQRVQFATLATKLCSSHVLGPSRCSRSRRVIELYHRCNGHVSPGWLLYGHRPQRRQARRSSGRADDQVRVGRQSTNCKAAAHRRAADAARARRQGDRSR
jgi:ABC transporter substrate binding protein